MRTPSPGNLEVDEGTRREVDDKTRHAEGSRQTVEKKNCHSSRILSPKKRQISRVK